MPPLKTRLEDDPLWYKDAIIYEVHIRAFHDSNGDGIGDLKGLTKKLDYLEDLGITAIWLLPFYPSPLKDDGYDISDYFGVHPDYGTLRDFREFLREAHKRGIRVITELVLNHTSDQHLWFKRARESRPGSSQRGFYVWSDTPEKYGDARIIFKDFESSNWAWDPAAKAYYWHRFYSHQPDLNFENPATQKAVFQMLDFWLKMGVDGLRLDAVPYLFEREGTNCENLPETYEFLKKLRGRVDRKFKNRMLLAEANQWPEDASKYFGEGDNCHMAFHFPLMPRMFMAVQMENRFPIIDILEQTPSIPEESQWALFLRNHDELTLEMVTDEERDYMYRVYATDPKARINLGIRRRLSPLNNNDRKKIELMNILLFSFPGTPVIYYGDEIGMGDNYYLGDRNGVRTPMQWSSDRNAGFSRANPQRLYLPITIDPEYHYEAVNVETQQRNPTSLLWWMKRTIATYKKFKAFGRGTMEFLFPANPKILAFTRSYEDETVLVLANLSRYFEVFDLDLSEYAGYYPEEVFGQNRLPTIGEGPYSLSLGPHNYLWLILQKEREITVAEKALPELKVRGEWKAVLDARTRERLERTVLPEYMKQRRWFGGKARTISTVSIEETIQLPGTSGPPDSSLLLILDVGYTEGPAEKYLLPLSFARDKATEKTGSKGEMTVKASRIMVDFPQSVIARLYVDGEEGILYDGVYDEGVQERLLELMERRKKARGSLGELRGLRARGFKKLLGDKETPLASRALQLEQTNTSILYGDTFFLKIFRRLEEGANPDLEIVRFLTEKARFANIPPFAGALVYESPGSEPVVVGNLQGFIPNEGVAWEIMLGVVDRYFERILSGAASLEVIPLAPASLMETGPVPPVLQEMIGGNCFEVSRLLGRRTAELHAALATAEEPELAPEPFSLLYQRSLYQSMRSLTRRVFQTLRGSIKKVPAAYREEASAVLEREKEILGSLEKILQKKFPGRRIRVHGDYHLGQVLFTGKDFSIIDFEGEPARPLSERRLKRSPLVDVAGMVRSFHYAAYAAILQHASIRPEDVPSLEHWAELWYCYVSGAFLGSYVESAGNAGLVPERTGDLETLMRAFLLEKAVYELGYEINNRPDWVLIPLRGIRHLLKEK